MQANPRVINLRGRWIVTTTPMVESINSPGILASFADREHAEAWLARYMEWRAGLAA